MGRRVSSIIRGVLLASCLVGCTADDSEDVLGVDSSALVTNPTVGGPFGSASTCASGAGLRVGPGAAVPAPVVAYLDAAAANWGLTHYPAYHLAASTGADGLGAYKWYRGSNNGWAGVAYWNNETQCAYYVPNTPSSCLGTGCTVQPNGTAPQLYQKYAALGWEDGVLGLPISNPVRWGWAGVTYQLFTNGVITYDATHGAHYAGGPDEDARALAEAWKRQFGASPTSGPATYAFMDDPVCTNTTGAPGDCAQSAGKDGRVVRIWDAYWGKPAYALARTGWDRGYVVWGPHAEVWTREAGATPWRTTGFPLSDLKTLPSGHELYRFEDATLYRTPSTQAAYLVAGEIHAHWSQPGRAAELGLPTGPEAPTLGDGGRVQSFTSGNVYVRPDGGVVAVEGGATNPTLRDYLERGGPRGPWGYPQTTPPYWGSTTVYGPPRGQVFDHGAYLPTATTTGTYLPESPYGGTQGLHLTTGSMWTDLHWTNIGTATERTVMRSIDNAPYVAIMGISTVATTASDNPYTAGQHGFPVRPEDRRVCYYIRTKRADGALLIGNEACHVPASRTKAVGRMTLAIRTSLRDDADTKHRVRVRLQHPDGTAGAPLPTGNSTWLDNTATNFTRGKVDVFDLDTGGIDDLADVSQLVIEVEGDDALCVAGIDLTANDVIVFSKEWGEEPCAWTELSTQPLGKRIVVADQLALRSFPAWQQYNTEVGNFPPVLGMDFEGNGHRFVGLDREAFISKLNQQFANAVLDGAEDPDGARFEPRFDDGEPTELLRLDDRRMRVVQNLFLNDGWYGDTHCWARYELHIVHEFADGPGQPATGAHMEIPSAQSEGACRTTGAGNWIPGWNIFANLIPAAVYEYGLDEALDGLDAMDLGAVPGGARYCFGGPGAILIFGGANGGMGPDSFSVCLGAP